MPIRDQLWATEAPPVAQPYHLPPTARMVGGKLIDRIERTCELTGLPWFQYRELKPTADPLPPGKTLWHGASQSPAERFAIMRKQIAYQVVETVESDPLGEELARFGREFPRIAEFIRADYKRTRLLAEIWFPIGQVRKSRSTIDPLHLTDAEIIGLLQRHLKGDFGIHGDVEGRLSDEESFCPEMFPAVARNNATVIADHGLVISAYNLAETEGTATARQKWEDEERAVYGSSVKPFHRRPNDVIHVVTLVAGPRSETIVFSSRDGLSIV